jgi:hypothetical protein
MTPSSPTILSGRVSATSKTISTSFWLHVCYAKIHLAGAREEDKDPADGEISSVVSAGIITPSAAAGPAFRADDDDDEAAPAAAAADDDDAATPPPGGG